MRDFLDEILAFIGSESLTDDEFASVGDIEAELSLETYKALQSVLEAREGVSGQQKKLRSYFIAKGVDITGTTLSKSSDIFIGVPL